MALLCRIKQMKPNNFFPHLKRCYFQIPVPESANYVAPKSIPDYCFRKKPNNQAICQRPVEFFNNRVRFFAAPVQVKKEEVKKATGPRLNEQITADVVRLVTDEGHWVVPRLEALKRAKNLELDLVEVDCNSKPPVCKLMDYQRERYKKKLKEKEKVKSKSAGTVARGACKEVRFSGKTELKDLKTKADAAKRLMERGYSVKCVAMGSEDQDLGGLLSQLAAMLEDVAVMESAPRVQSDKLAYMIVRHVKFGPSKKGGKVQKASTPSSQSQSPADSEPPGLGDDDKVEAWSVSDGNNDTDEIFDLSHDVRGGGRPTDNRVPNLMGPAPNVRPRPSSQEPEPEPENRYARNVTKNTSPSPARNPTRFPDYGNQPQPRSNVRPPGPPRQAPQNEIPQARGQFPNREPRSNVRPPGPPRQAPQNEIPQARGQFPNREPPSSAGSHRSPPQGNFNSPTPTFDGSHGSKWGIFSKE